jgi:hypothetical protein
METILTFFSAITFNQFMVLIFVISVLYILYNLTTNEFYWREYYRIKNSYINRIQIFVSEEMKLIQNHCENQAYTILGIDTNHENDSKEFIQFMFYALVLKDTLAKIVYVDIMQSIEVDMFFELNDKELEEYINGKSHVLLTSSRAEVSKYYHFFPLLRGTDDDRFNLENTKGVYRRIVVKVISLNNEQAEELKILKHKYDFWHKLIGLFKFFKKK